MRSFLRPLLTVRCLLRQSAANCLSQRMRPNVILQRLSPVSSSPAFLSHNAAHFSLDDPAIEKYLVTFLRQYETNKSLEKPPYLFRLNELLEQRNLTLKNIGSLNELKQDGGNEEMKTLVEEEYGAYQRELAEIDSEVSRLLVPRNPHELYSDILVEISSGAGGQEAMLFAHELFQLYENYASLRGWTFLVDAIDKSDLGGIRSASVFIHGNGAFRHMQNEIGIHRVQRVPITSSAGMIHTSTAAVIVMPQPTEVDIKLDDKDLLIETKRASGPGGQNVNKTESAVRVKHLPTGIAVECQEHQSQIRNKTLALMKLRTKLYDIEIQKQSKSIQATRQSQLGNRDRSEKIRTYNFPQNRVTDHRCQVTSHNIKEIMGGGNAFHTFVQKLIEHSDEKALLEFISSLKQM